MVSFGIKDDVHFAHRICINLHFLSGHQHDLRLYRCMSSVLICLFFSRDVVRGHAQVGCGDDC